mmetsp:Transcript_34088/g.108828  ORF Transcript_34088/g.108828 Transcript_34088/m.108828 type:complete len:283 (+) Transcript_34088:236-1084(+)
MSRSWTRRMRAHPARPPKARSTRRWLACGPCWKTQVQTRGASLARRVGQSCGSGTGRASAKVVDDLLASLGAATVPAPGYAQLPFSRASDVRRALEGYAAQHHLGFEARDIRFENGLHQLTTRTMYVRSGSGFERRSSLASRATASKSCTMRTVIASTAGRSAASGELARAGQGDALCGAHLLGQDYREGAVLLPDGDAELPAPPRRAAQARELPRDRAPPRAQEARVRRGTLPSRRSDSITAKTLADSRARGHAEAFSEPSLNLLGAFPREPSREGRPRRC